MNILFFLTPKSDVKYIYDDISVAEAVKELEESKYSAVPIINRKGIYQGTLSEGDLLWSLINDYSFKEETFLDERLSKIIKKNKYKPIKVNEKVSNMLNRVINQNFVPVIDDDDVFIGIVKRRDVISYYAKEE